MCVCVCVRERERDYDSKMRDEANTHYFAMIGQLLEENGTLG